MQLKPGTKLQNGKYEIVRVLGQGGFGITYEAEQVLLRRKFALKEFFMKDCCERDEATSLVTVGTGSQRALVEKFRGKFIREAQMMAGFDHPNIVRVTDVFEENGTAYYVMENLPGGSLADKVKKEGPLSEVQAEKYIRQVADALAYIHSQNTVHLDVKPSNVLLNVKGDAVLIDFGISKHYDDSGEQTSSTPVGISKGYAPLEQSRDGDVSQFKPSTDIYALGATLYFFVTGAIPPESSIINEDGLDRPSNISDRIWKTIEQAMQPRRKDRPQSIESFLALLDTHATVEETIVRQIPAPKSEINDQITKTSSTEENKSKTLLWVFLVLALACCPFVLLVFSGVRQKDDNTRRIESGSIFVNSTPSKAIIWLDGKNTGLITPSELNNITVGKHKVLLQKAGCEDFSCTIVVNQKQQVSVNGSLKELPNQTSSKPSNSNSTKPSNNAGEDKSVPVSGKEMSLSKSNISLKVGESATLVAKNYGRSLEWTSDDTSIATVSSGGVVKAISKGETMIWAKGDGGVYCCCMVNVYEFNNKPVQSNNSPKSSSKAIHIYIPKGESRQLSIPNVEVDRWETDDRTIATVLSNSGVLYALKTGTTNVWAWYGGSVQHFIIHVQQ